MNKTKRILNSVFYCGLGIYCIAWILSFYQTNFFVWLNELNYLLIWISAFEFAKQLSFKLQYNKSLKFPIIPLVLIISGILIHVPIYIYYVMSHSEATYHFKLEHLFFIPYLKKNIYIIFQVLTILLLTYLTCNSAKRFQKL